MRGTLKYFLFLGLMTLSSSPALAADTVAGDACTTLGQTRSTGGPSTTANVLVCNGSIWKSGIEFNSAGNSYGQIGNDTGTCTSAKLGRLRYNGTSTWEYCNGTAWTTFGGGGGASTSWLYRH